MKGFTTREVAEVLDLTPHQVRSYARSDLLAPGRGPRNEYLYSFQDIILLRTTRELMAARVDPRKIRRALRRLREQLPVGRPLSAVHVTAEGDHVVVRDRDTIWDPESEQVVFQFPVAELATKLEPIALRAVEERTQPDRMTADDWYNLGFDLEAVTPDQAQEAYRNALSRDPHHAEALLNLGRLVHEAGDAESAERHYREALAADPGNATASFNIGVALEDLERPLQAIKAYDQAIGADPDHASSHYNLYRLYEASGFPKDALRHLAQYKRLREQGGGSESA